MKKVKDYEALNKSIKCLKAEMQKLPIFKLLICNI